MTVPAVARPSVETLREIETRVLCLATRIVDATHHPEVGEQILNDEALVLAPDPGRRLNIYNAESGSAASS